MHQKVCPNYINNVIDFSAILISKQTQIFVTNINNFHRK